MCRNKKTQGQLENVTSFMEFEDSMAFFYLALIAIYEYIYNFFIDICVYMCVYVCINSNVHCS